MDSKFRGSNIWAEEGGLPGVSDLLNNHGFPVPQSPFSALFVRGASKSQDDEHKHNADKLETIRGLIAASSNHTTTPPRTGTLGRRKAPDDNAPPTPTIEALNNSRLNLSISSIDTDISFSSPGFGSSPHPTTSSQWSPQSIDSTFPSPHPLLTIRQQNRPISRLQHSVLLSPDTSPEPEPRRQQPSTTTSTLDIGFSSLGLQTPQQQQQQQQQQQHHHQKRQQPLQQQKVQQQQKAQKQQQQQQQQQPSFLEQLKMIREENARLGVVNDGLCLKFDKARTQHHQAQYMLVQLEAEKQRLIAQNHTMQDQLAATILENTRLQSHLCSQ